jgi:multimeric flavodoxin WrbA
MKILALIGSHRKNGSSYRVVNEVEKCLKKWGDVEFEYLFLTDVKLEMCRGCGLCLSVGDDKCPLKDDRELIERKLLDSAGVIFVSPVYAMNMTALMKSFMDRFAFTMHRPRFFNQYTLIVCVTGWSGLKETIASISALRYCGFNIIDSLGVIKSDFERSPDNEKDKVHRNILAVSDRLYKAIKEKRRYSASFNNLVQFRVQQAIFPLLKEFQPCDYNYFQKRGWFDRKKRYYIASKINPVKEWLAKLIAGMAYRNTRRELE